jgi:hypothetical protein
MLGKLYALSVRWKPLTFTVCGKTHTSSSRSGRRPWRAAGLPLVIPNEVCGVISVVIPTRGTAPAVTRGRDLLFAGSLVGCRTLRFSRVRAGFPQCVRARGIYPDLVGSPSHCRFLLIDPLWFPSIGARHLSRSGGHAVPAAPDVNSPPSEPGQPELLGRNRKRPQPK